MCLSTRDHGFAQFSADGSQLWVTSEIGGTVSVIDPATRKIIKKITFAVPGVAEEALQPVGVRLTNDGAKAFVALGPSNRVAVVNAKTLVVEKYLLVGQRVWQLGFTPDQKYLFSTNGVSNDVSVIDVASEKVIKSIPTGRFPWGVVVAKGLGSGPLRVRKDITAVGGNRAHQETDCRTARRSCLR